MNSIGASNVASDELLIDLNELRKENTLLKAAVAEFESRSVPEDTNLAALDELCEVTLHWKVSDRSGSYKNTEKVTATWEEMFARIAPDLAMLPNDGSVNYQLGSSLHRKLHPGVDKTVQIEHDDFQTIRVQLCALNLISVSYRETTRGSMALFWSLTTRGQRLVMQLRTVKAASS